MDGWDKVPSFDAGEAPRRSTSSLGPMIKRLGKVLVCFLVALAVGIAACFAADAARSPGVWSHPEWLWTTALTDALFYVAVPLAALTLLAIFRPTLSTLLAVLVAVGWLTIVFAWWAYKPWVYYGQFPWSGFRQHYLGLLPVPLSFGLAFGLCARTILGPNNRLERSRVASSVSQKGSR
jgi:hypothetical protein